MLKNVAGIAVVLALLLGCAGTPEEGKVDVSIACPVSGTDLGPRQTAHAVEYEGETYYFCCGSCKRNFEKDPERYLGK